MILPGKIPRSSDGGFSEQQNLSLNFIISTNGYLVSVLKIFVLLLIQICPALNCHLSVLIRLFLDRLKSPLGPDIFSLQRYLHRGSTE